MKFPNTGIMTGPHLWCADCQGVGQFRIDTSTFRRVPYMDCARCRGTGVVFMEDDIEYPGLKWMDVPLVKSEEVNYSVGHKKNAATQAVT